MSALAASTPSAGPVALPRPEAFGADYFDLDAARAALEAGRPVRFPPFELAHWGGLTWALNYRDDPVQASLRRGRFYEAPELAALHAAVGEGARVIDIGANIGNHAVYFATRMNAARVVVVEPNPLSIAPLLANVVVNRLGGVICTDLLGVGLSDRSEAGFRMARHDRNLGATKMSKPRGRAAGSFAVHAGDDLFAEETPDLIKLDVEGMELRVLGGLRQTVERCRPVMLVEVQHQNLPGFEAWCAALRYRPANRWDVGPKNANHLIEPAEGRVSGPRGGMPRDQEDH